MRRASLWNGGTTLCIALLATLVLGLAHSMQRGAAVAAHAPASAWQARAPPVGIEAFERRRGRAREAHGGLEGLPMHGEYPILQGGQGDREQGDHELREPEGEPEEDA